MKFINEADLLEKVQKQIKEKKGTHSFAAFDADGTLWPEDVNTLFLKYQEKYKLRNFSDLFSEEYKEKKRSQRCQEIARRQEGFRLEDLKQQIQKAFEEFSIHVFPLQKKLLNYLKEQGVFIYVVTASVRWIAEEAVKKYKLPVDKVLGIEPHVKNGMITSELISPLTYGEGKRESLLKERDSNDFLLAAGNSLNDVSLLETSKISLVINQADSENENYTGEQKLQQLASQKNWIIFKT